MKQSEKDLADLLNIFTGRYFEFQNFIEEKCKDISERENWKERLNQLIDLSRVVGIFSQENQDNAVSLNNNNNESFLRNKEIDDDKFL